jgi:ABC-2 type transport system permease protein
MLTISIAIACFSSGIGSIVEDMQGFQAINQFIVFPLYFLSGALYPLNVIPSWLRIITEVNPMAYSVDALRWALIGQTKFGILKDLIAIGITLVLSLAFGVWRFRRIEA